MGGLTMRRDPMDRMIESAFQPGRFIPYHAGYSFVRDLRRAEAEIAELIATDPARVVTLYQTFLAGCHAKAEEIDDSDGDFGLFAGSVFCGWIRARQAAGVDRDETARLLLRWMDDDPYGFCNDLELAAVKVLDPAGLAAFERACGPTSTRSAPRSANGNAWRTESQLRPRPLGSDAEGRLFAATQCSEVH